MDLTGEHRNAAIARANEMADQTVERKEEDEVRDEEEEGTDDDKVDSTLVEDEDSDESETSMDELALDYRPPPTKRSSSNSHWSHRRKRETSKSSSQPRGDGYRCSSTQRSTAMDNWTFAEGRFHRFRGKTKVDSRNDHPRDVWVYNKDGWSNGGGKQWCLWKSDETADYR
jgi:hypothetical protein